MKTTALQLPLGAGAVQVLAGVTHHVTDGLVVIDSAKHVESPPDGVIHHDTSESLYFLDIAKHLVEVPPILHHLPEGLYFIDSVRRMVELPPVVRQLTEDLSFVGGVEDIPGR